MTELQPPKKSYFVHLKTGWERSDFEKKINESIETITKMGFSFKDIKVSSSSANTLLIFEK